MIKTNASWNAQLLPPNITNKPKPMQAVKNAVLSNDKR
jgi:hypothetical protein